MFEAHPVPQNVTEFQFHLVGDMTIKQFIYLGAGIGLAYLTFILIGNVVPILAYPLIVLFAGIGAALAFLPIQERPLDHWLASYLHAIFQPTKRSYKSKILTKEDPLFKTRLQVYLNTRKNALGAAAGAAAQMAKPKATPFSFSMSPIQQSQPQQPLISVPAPAGPAVKPVAPAPLAPLPPIQPQPSPVPAAPPPPPAQPTLLGTTGLSPIAIPTTQPPQPTVSAAPIASPTMPTTAAPQPNNVTPSESDLKQTIEIAKQVHEVQQKILKTNEQIGLIRSKAAAQDANPKEYLDQFHQLLGELQTLNQQAAQLSQQVAVLTNEPINQIDTQPEMVVKAKSIPTITLTSIANVINGIVTDSNGGYLDGAIILAHDKQGIPVRALKTNKLGQFVAATPLNNGIFTITIEKDELVFDTIEIELNGSVLKPILITAKPVAGGGVVAHG